MSYILPIQDADPAAERMSQLAAVEAALAAISPKPEQHQCPGNSPCGHHDAEAIGQKARFCHRFILGCAHPLPDTEGGVDSDGVRATVLADSLRTLRDLGAVSESQYDDLRKRLDHTRRELWHIDTARRGIIHAWANAGRNQGMSAEVMAAELPAFSHDLDKRFRPAQRELVLQRLGFIIEMQAHILDARTRWQSGEPMPLPITESVNRDRAKKSAESTQWSFLSALQRLLAGNKI